jgi:hypothetical protein
MTAIYKYTLFFAVFIFSSIAPYSLFSQVTNENTGNNDKYGSNPESCKMNLSLYIEFYNQKNLDAAYLPWSLVFRECPKSSKNIYIHGASIVMNKINKAKDPITQGKFIDTLMMMYDTRIQIFGEDGKVLGSKGIDFYKLYPQKNAEAFKILDQSIQLEGNNSDALVALTYFSAASDLEKDKNITEEQFLDYYNKSFEIISSQLNQSTDSVIISNLISTQEKLDLILLNNGKATCDILVPVFTKKFELHKEDIASLKNIVKLLSKQECIDSKLYAEASEQLYKLEPSSFSAYALAKLSFKNNDYSKASTFYLQAIDLEKSPQKKAQYYYELASMNGTKLSKMEDARSYALKAIENRKGWGKPYILIGTLYAQSAKNCGDNPFIQSMTYIAAVDKFIQAKTLDHSCAKEAEKYISLYSPSFPSKQESLSKNIKEGDSYTIGCWINETIKVRFNQP